MYAELSLDSCIEHPDYACTQRTCLNHRDFLQRKIDLLNQVIHKIDQEIKPLARKDSTLSKNNIQGELQRISWQITNNVMLEKNNFCQKNIFSHKSSIGLDSTLTFSPQQKIYQVPVEINVEPLKQKIYQIPLALEKFEINYHQDIEAYLNKIQYWRDLENSLQKCIERLVQTKTFQPPTSKNTHHLDLSFFKCEESEENLDGSFSLSEVRKRRVSEVSVKQTSDSCAQTDQEKSKEIQIKKNLVKVYEVPLEFQVEAEIEEKETQTELAQIKLTDNGVNNILTEVDVVLEEIQDILVDFVRDQAEDEQGAQSEISNENNEEQIKNARIVEDSYNGENFYQADEIMSRLSKLLSQTPQCLESKEENFSPKTLEQIDREIKDELKMKEEFNNDTFKELNLAMDSLNRILYQNYEIPIQCQLIDQGQESDEEIDYQYREMTVEEARLDQNYFQLEEEKFKQLDNKIQNIRKIIQENPQEIDQFFKVEDLSLEESESYQAMDYTMNPERNGRGQWEEVNGELFAMEKIIKSIPRDIIEERSFSQGKKDQEIQTGVELCRVQEDYLSSQKDWEEINNSIFNIQKSLNEIPRIGEIMNCHEYFEFRQITEVGEEYEETYISQYEIPVDMEIVRSVENSSNVSADSLEVLESSLWSSEKFSGIPENRLEEQAFITSQFSKVNVKNYEITYEMDLIEDSLSENNFEEQIQTRGKKLAINSNLINEIFHNVVETSKFYEIPIQLYVEEEFSVAEVEIEEDLIEQVGLVEEDEEMFAGETYFIVEGASDDSSEEDEQDEQDEQSSVDEIQTEQKEVKETQIKALEEKKITVETQTQTENENCLSTPQKEEEHEFDLTIKSCNYPPDSLDTSIRPLKTNRMMEIEPLEFKGSNNLKNLGNVIDLDVSEGNQTDRSIYLQKVLNNSVYRDRNSSITSRFLKEDTINAEDFYELKENIKYIEEERDKLIQALIQSENQLRKVEKENKIQNKYIEDMNKLHEHDNNAYSVEIYHKIQKITKLQAQINFNLGIINALERDKELQMEEIEELERQLEKKSEKISEGEEQMKKIQETMNQEMKLVKLEYEQKAAELEQKEKQYHSEIYSLKEINEELKNLNEQLIKDNNSLSNKINDKNSKIDELGQKQTELMQGLESALIQFEESKSSPEKKMKNLYQGEFKKKTKFYEKELNSKETLVNNLKYEKKSLEEKLSKIEEENIKFKENQFMYNSMQNSMLNPGFSYLAPTCSVFSPQQYNYSEVRTINCDMEAGLREEIIEELSKKLALSNSQLIDKDAEINNLRVDLENIKEKLSALDSTSSKKRTSPVKETITQKIYDDYSMEYINKLESVIKTYEQIISDNQYQIKQLQKNLLESMEDGLEKEVQLEELEQILRRADLPIIPEEGQEVHQFMDISLESDNMKAPATTPQQSLVEEEIVKGSGFTHESIEEIFNKEKIIREFNSTSETRNLQNNMQHDDSLVFGKLKCEQQRLMKKQGNQTLRINLDYRY